MEYLINQLIVKVLNQEASSDDIILFSRWLAEDEANGEEFRKLKSYWDAEISFKHTLSPEVSLQQTQQKIRYEQHRLKTNRRIRYGLSIAAAIAVLFGIGFFFMNPRIINTPVEYYTYLTDQNKTNFTLSDGTKIYLNKNSKLVYTNQYDKTERLVKLEGEAYFEVQHNPEKTFIVEVGEAQIQVLGTSFNVKSDRQANVQATLVEGSIRFESPDQQVILTPNQQLTYTNDSRRLEVTSVDLDEEVAWTEGVIRHKNRLFSDLMNDLMKQFDVHIIIQNDRLKNSSVFMTGTFAEDQSLEAIFRVIAVSYPFTWEKKGDSYIVK